MPNCDFYALPEDCCQVLDFIFQQPGWLLYELASQHDSMVRAFRSTEAVLAAFPLCERALHFQLYAPEMQGRVIHKKVVFRAGAVPGATFRHDTCGWGLIQLYLGFLRPDGSLTACHTNHNSETRAAKWSSTLVDLGPIADWDWRAVERTSSRLVRFIRKTGASKQWSRPILPVASVARDDGRVTLVL